MRISGGRRYLALAFLATLMNPSSATSNQLIDGEIGSVRGVGQKFDVISALIIADDLSKRHSNRVVQAEFKKLIESRRSEYDLSIDQALADVGNMLPVAKLISEEVDVRRRINSFFLAIRQVSQNSVTRIRTMFDCIEFPRQSCSPLAVEFQTQRDADVESIEGYAEVLEKVLGEGTSAAQSRRILMEITHDLTFEDRLVEVFSSYYYYLSIE